MAQTEVWKPIDGYEQRYEVSNLGNVRSLNWRGTGSCKVLAVNNQNRGYLQVRLSDGVVSKAHLVHRLVAMAFVKDFHDGMVVNHINEDKTDNRACNLEWVSQKVNVDFSQEKHPKTVKNPYKRVSPIVQLTLSGEKLREFSCVKEVKHILGYDPTSVKGCCDGVRKTAYGYKWQYAI